MSPRETTEKGRETPNTKIRRKRPEKAETKAKKKRAEKLIRANKRQSEQKGKRVLCKNQNDFSQELLGTFCLDTRHRPR